MDYKTYRKTRDYQNAYKKEHYKMVTFKFNKQNDADIIEKIDSVENKLDYIRELVRADIKRHK